MLPPNEFYIKEKIHYTWKLQFDNTVSIREFINKCKELNLDPENENIYLNTNFDKLQKKDRCPDCWSTFGYFNENICELHLTEKYKELNPNYEEENRKYNTYLKIREKNYDRDFYDKCIMYLRDPDNFEAHKCKLVTSINSIEMNNSNLLDKDKIIKSKKDKLEILNKVENVVNQLLESIK